MNRLEDMDSSVAQYPTENDRNTALSVSSTQPKNKLICGPRTRGCVHRCMVGTLPLGCNAWPPGHWSS
eukprot:scaffold1591_cov176-Amphora_coffeaeformis.AAC.1